MSISQDTLLLLGTALFRAQKIEFILYGIASHLGHLDIAKNDKIFSKITAKDFLSDDPKKQRLRIATLGRVYKLFGETLMISNLPFDLLVNERNFFVRNFFREVTKSDDNFDYIQRLNIFIDLMDFTEKALKGLLSNLMEAAAKKEGRLHELTITSEDEENRKFYLICVWLCSGLIKPDTSR